MTANTPDLQELKSIVDWVKLNEDVREFSLKYGGVEVFMSRNEQTQSIAPLPATAHAAAQSVPASPSAADTDTDTDTGAPAPVSKTTTAAEVILAHDEVAITAPMVGTFYASPQPGSPAFVSVGDRVEPDTVLCIVEVMKLMNNIEAGVAGTVSRVLVENESGVQYGQTLIVIRKEA